MLDPYRYFELTRLRPDDVQERLALLDAHGMEGALDGGRHFCRVFDTLAVAAAGLAEHLEVEGGREVAEGLMARALLPAVRVDAAGGTCDGVPSGVVPDDIEHGQVHLARHPVPRLRHAEHV